MPYHLREKHYRIWLLAGWMVTALAYLWRRLLFRTTFVAVTGSVGKTTTKQCIGAVLGSRLPTVMTFDTQNAKFFAARTILRVRPWHRFAVLEVATNAPGRMWQEARLVSPDIAVIVGVARTHTKRFDTIEQTAAEKARMLDALRPGGTAILNGDDPHVAAMKSRFRGQVRMYGRAPGFDLWASEVSSIWPARLSFRAHWGDQSLRVNTKLVGEHWLSVALASLCTALSCGMDLQSAAAALEQVEPYRGRLEPMMLPSGAVLLRDDFSDDFCTLEPALQVLRNAVARRRVLIVSGVLDPLSKTNARFGGLGETVAQAADLIVFVGEDSAAHAQAAIVSGMDPENVRSFPALPEAAEFLKSNLHDGDLALLRGYLMDHVQRLYFAQLGTVNCWIQSCSKQILCDHCPELRPGLENASSVPSPVRPFWHPL